MRFKQPPEVGGAGRPRMWVQEGRRALQAGAGGLGGEAHPGLTRRHVLCSPRAADSDGPVHVEAARTRSPTCSTRDVHKRPGAPEGGRKVGGQPGVSAQPRASSERETVAGTAPKHGLWAALCPSPQRKWESEMRVAPARTEQPLGRPVHSGQACRRLRTAGQSRTLCPHWQGCAHVRAGYRHQPLSTRHWASVSHGSQTQRGREFRGGPRGPVLPLPGDLGPPPFTVLEHEWSHGARSSELPGGRTTTDPNRLCPHSILGTSGAGGGWADSGSF